jgi:hypothetical protein
MKKKRRNRRRKTKGRKKKNEEERKIEEEDGRWCFGFYLSIFRSGVVSVVNRIVNPFGLSLEGGWLVWSIVLLICLILLLKSGSCG